MGSESSSQSDETIEAQERFQDQQTGNFGGSGTNVSDPSQSVGFSDDPNINRRYAAGQQLASEIVSGQTDSPSMPNVQARQVQADPTFAQEQFNIDELGFDPNTERIDVGFEFESFPFLSQEIERQLALGNRPVYNPDGTIGGVTSRLADTRQAGLLPMALQNLLPEAQVFTGRPEIDPNQSFFQDDGGGDNNNENMFRRRTTAEMDTPPVTPPVSDDLALNVLQNPFFLYSGRGNLFQPYGYAPNTLVDLLGTRNLTQPSSAAPNLNLFGNPRDFV
tara:strand:+ start:234 stop:1064 length:831 start_codon:yes stop_codon:yes gene_type:complete